MAELAEDPEPWLRHESICARPAGVAKRLWWWCRRNKVAAGLILSLCSGLGATIVLLHLANEQRYGLDLIRGQHEMEFARQIDDLWMNTNQEGVLIPSYELKALGDLKPRPPGQGELRLTFSVKILAYPLGQAKNYAPFLARLEEKMKRILKRPVTFDIYFFRMSEGPARPLVSGSADFERMGALAYIRTKHESPGIQLLVREKNDREAVIFARKELGITSLAGVKGYRVAFAHTNSTISFIAKVQLAKANVSASSLKFYTNLLYRDPLSAGPVKDNPSGVALQGRDFNGEGIAHKEVTQQVLANHFDVGEVQRNYFELFKYKGKGLVELNAYKVPSNVHVARTGLAPSIAEAYKTALLEMQSKEEQRILEGLQTSRIESFLTASDADYDDLRFDSANWVLKFGQQGEMPSRMP
jgi:ABC-type phosphate/phosphonate transport system substrate-binding protein